MAKIKGTNGDDTLTGTSGDDTILPLLGMDQVDGGAGYDTLNIDYSAVTSSVFPGSMTLAGDGTWSGGVSSGVTGGPVNAVGFENVERVVFSASQDVDYLTVDLGSLAILTSRLRLDGGGGDDQLVIRAQATDAATALTLKVAADGTIASNVGVLSGWETFDIALGKAIGNKVTLGAGDDAVRSTGGKDILDLGAGNDEWTADYTGRSDALGFSYYGATTGIVVNSASANLATVKNVETALVYLGSGNDTVNFYDGAGAVYGDGGDDTLIVHPTSTTAAQSVFIQAGAAGLGGTIEEKTSPTPFHFETFRTATIGGSLGADSFALDLSQQALGNFGVAYTLEGGGGSDDLLLDLRGQGAATLSATADGIGFGTLAFAGSANTFAFRNMELLNVKFGAGNDRIEAGLAGVMTVDGGAGTDTIDFGKAGQGIVFDLGFIGSQSAGPNTSNYTVKNVENLVGSSFGDTISDSMAANVIQAGAGNDTVLSGIVSADADSFDGGAGIDTIDYQRAGAAVTVSLALTSAQATGGGGTDTLTGFERLGGSAYGDVLTGNDGDNVINGGFANGAGPEGNDLIEGLGGNDTMDGGGGINTVTYAHATAAVTVSLATNQAQDTKGAGTDRLFNFANLTGSAYDDTLTGNGDGNVLTGGFGTDQMTGGGGADRFVFRSTAETSTEFLRSDLITDFKGPSRVAGDVIDLSAIDANALTFRTNEAFTFIGGAAFSGSAGQLRAESFGNGLFYVSGDTNGDKAADFGIYVQSTDTAIVKADFVL